MYLTAVGKRDFYVYDNQLKVSTLKTYYPEIVSLQGIKTDGRLVGLDMVDGKIQIMQGIKRYQTFYLPKK